MISSKAYTQVNEIIKYMTQEMQEKIPEDLKKTIEYNADKEYLFEIENLDEINLLEDTEKLLAVLYTDYFATGEERQVILAKEKMLENKKELDKQNFYPSDFMKKQLNENKQKQENALMIKKEKIYIQIFNKLKEILGNIKFC